MGRLTDGLLAVRLVRADQPEHVEPVLEVRRIQVGKAKPPTSSRWGASVFPIPKVPRHRPFYPCPECIRRAACRLGPCDGSLWWPQDSQTGSIPGSPGGDRKSVV